ncbi:MAG: hypothetical protein F2754_12765 [Actinobacteria bacterium]|nr:hypothetical protein [Actinomycetota bacterium]MSW90153.1 hypothetical protein [Actinomycetota bacterium]MSX88248.1 hypothetical protein [Actinomycetota bacterium]MSY72548.1 hypothetical protein [Actinomycetota bacterium]
MTEPFAAFVDSLQIRSISRKAFASRASAVVVSESRFDSVVPDAPTAA